MKATTIKEKSNGVEVNRLSMYSRKSVLEFWKEESKMVYVLCRKVIPTLYFFRAFWKGDSDIVSFYILESLFLFFF